MENFRPGHFCIGPILCACAPLLAVVGSLAMFAFVLAQYFVGIHFYNSLCHDREFMIIFAKILSYSEYNTEHTHTQENRLAGPISMESYLGAFEDDHTLTSYIYIR